MRPLSFAVSPAQPTSSTRSSSPAASAARYFLRRLSGTGRMSIASPPGVIVPEEVARHAGTSLVLIFFFVVVFVVIFIDGIGLLVIVVFKQLVGIRRSKAHANLSALDVRVEVLVEHTVGH